MKSPPQEPTAAVLRDCDLRVRGDRDRAAGGEPDGLAARPPRLERRPQHLHGHRLLPLHRRRVLRLPPVRRERPRQRHPQPPRR